MTGILCIIAALLIGKALLWVGLVSLGYWLGFSDWFDE